MPTVKPLYEIVQIGKPIERPKAGNWGGSAPIEVGKEQDNVPENQLERLAFHAQHALGGAVITNAEGTVRYAQPNRILTNDQCHLIYQRTADVRAAFDQIARTVATADWSLEVTGLSPEDPGYDDALLVAEMATLFLKSPNANDWTWQEVVTAWVTDLLKFDSGPVELCRNPDGTLNEIVPVNGGEVVEVVDDHGLLLHYQQLPLGIGDTAANAVKIDPENMLLLQLFRSTEGPGGIPLLESIVHEVIAVLRGAEYIAQNLDLNEIPPGLLVVTGLANDALERFRSTYEGKANQDWKIRMLAGPAFGGPVDARWVELKRSPREVQITELLKEIRRAIWRVCGVAPIMMGDTEKMPRASAQVQLDASNSHLIQPILELVQAKVNSRIIPLLVPEDLVGVIEFKFRTERDLEESEKFERAKRLNELVGGKIITRNEARSELGLDPIDGGDDFPEDNPMFPSDPVEARPDGDPNDADGVPEPAGTDDGEGRTLNPLTVTTRRRRARVQAIQMRHKHGPNCRHRTSVVRGSAEEFLPSEWQADGKFKGFRTANLPKLGEEVAGYARDVEPLWETARTAVIAAVASRYQINGFDETKRAEVTQAIGEQLDKMLIDWAVTTAPRYERVALDARAESGDWVAVLDSEEDVRAQASLYRDKAIAFLLSPGAPVDALRNELIGLLNQIGDTRSVDHRFHQRGPRLPADADPSQVLQRVGHIFDAQRHRIKMWSGRLVELSHLVIAGQLANDVQEVSIELGKTGPGESRALKQSKTVDWWCEWVAVHDKGTCQTCMFEGMQPMRPVSTLRTFPGGDTQCMARCRCVLVYWTRDEVQDGTAERLGQSEEIDPGSFPARIDPDDTVPTTVQVADDVVDDVVSVPDVVDAAPTSQTVASATIDDGASAIRGPDVWERPWMSDDPNRVLASIDSAMLRGPDWLEELASLSDERLLRMVEDLTDAIASGTLRSGGKHHYLNVLHDLFKETVEAVGEQTARQVVSAHMMKATRAIRARMLQRDLMQRTRNLGGDWSYESIDKPFSNWGIDSSMIQNLERLGYENAAPKLIDDVVLAIRNNDHGAMRRLVGESDELFVDLELEFGIFKRAKALDKEGRELMARAIEEWREAHRLNLESSRFAGLRIQEALREYRTSESGLHVLMNEGVDRNTSVILESQRVPVKRELFSDGERVLPPAGVDVPDMVPRSQEMWDWGFHFNRPERNEMMQSVIWQTDGILSTPASQFAGDVLYPPLSILDHMSVQGARLRAHALRETRRATPDFFVQNGDGFSIVPGTHWFRGMQIPGEVLDSVEVGMTLDLTGASSFSLNLGESLGFTGTNQAERALFRMRRDLPQNERSISAMMKMDTDNGEIVSWEALSNARKVRVVNITTMEHPNFDGFITRVFDVVVEL